MNHEKVTCLLDKLNEVINKPQKIKFDQVGVFYVKKGHIMIYNKLLLIKLYLVPWDLASRLQAVLGK